MEKDAAIRLFGMCAERNAIMGEKNRKDYWDGDDLAHAIAQEVEGMIWVQATAEGWGRELHDICNGIELED